jgi:hypothetical protein
MQHRSGRSDRECLLLCACARSASGRFGEISPVSRLIGKGRDGSRAGNRRANSDGLKRAESAPNGVAARRTAVRAIALIPYQARNRVHRLKRNFKLRGHTCARETSRGPWLWPLARPKEIAHWPVKLLPSRVRTWCQSRRRRTRRATGSSEVLPKSSSFALEVGGGVGSRFVAARTGSRQGFGVLERGKVVHDAYA